MSIGKNSFMCLWAHVQPIFIDTGTKQQLT